MSLNFGQALEAINDNSEICGHRAYTEPCIAMYTADGKLQPGWLASQMDLLATDWEIL